MNNKNYIIFRDGKMKFLKPAFRHCILIRGNLAYQSSWGKIRISHISSSDKQKLLDRFVRVQIKQDLDGWFRGLTCVSAIKRMMGIKCWWLITPHQLYKRLK